MGALERKRKEEDTELNENGEFCPQKNIFEVFCKSKKVHTCSSAMVSQWY